MSGEGAREHQFAVMAFGDSPYLAGCLASLRAQTIPAQILVATSTPSAQIAATAEAAGAALLVNPERAGIAADWNFALRAGGTRLVTLAHQDDLYYPTFLARSLELLRQGAGVAFTGYEEVGDDGAPTRSRLSAVKHALERAFLGRVDNPGPARLRRFLAFGNPLPCSSATFDLARIGDFAFSGEFRSNLDWDAWLRLIEDGVAFARTPERLVGRRHNPLTATSALIKEGVRANEDLVMFRRLWPSPLAELIALAYKAGYR
jgi:hypothetical protein